jgi:hypothetical protein
VLGDRRHAAVLYELIYPFASQYVVLSVTCLGAAARSLGLLATVLQRWNDAAAHFEMALERNARLGSRPILAHTQYDYACMLRARNGAGDRDRAGALLAAARATAESLGMAQLAADCAESPGA